MRTVLWRPYGWLACALLLVSASTHARAGTALDAAAGEVKEYLYKKTPQGDLNLFVHFPKDWTPADRRPAIVFFFGGAWRTGSPQQFAPQAEYFAGRGMIAVRADYRVLSRHQTTPDKAVEDARSAMRWVRAHAGQLGLDPGRIVASGGSAGGHLAAAAALLDRFDADSDDRAVSPRPNALVLFNPVFDLRNLGPEAPNAGPMKEALSPIVFYKKPIPPTIIFYGTKDRFLDQGRAFLARSKEVGGRVELYTAEGMPHGFFNRPPWTESTLRATDAFLASIGCLKGEPTIAVPAGKADLSKVE